MRDPILDSLGDFGLSDKEARIYVALLELGSATAFEVAKHSGINRSSAYVVLEALTKKGLAGLAGDDKVRQYTAASPEALALISSEALKKSEITKTGIEAILPKLNALNKNMAHRPKVRVFEGVEGLITALIECLANKEKLLRIFS